MGILANVLKYVLAWTYRLVGNYGITLIILTVLVKMISYPLYAKQMKSSIKMTILQPKIQEIQQRYAKDRDTMAEKLSDLYREEHVSMSSGCLPMLFQMIIVVGLFTLLRNPMTYLSSMDVADEMLFAIHEPFLWIRDLAQPDHWVLPISAALATYFSFSMSQRNNLAGGAQQKMNGLTRVMSYITPLTILLLARSYPAGLSLYWFFSQVIQIFFNIRFNQIRRKMLEDKPPKGKKKVKARAKVPAQA